NRCQQRSCPDRDRRLWILLLLNADFLSSGLGIAFNFWWIESRQMRAEIEIDLPLPAARLTYMLILLPSAVDMVRLLVQTEPGAPVWLRAIAHPALLLAVLSIAATLSHVLYRGWLS